MKSLCVFCGSKSGANPEYLHSARVTGELLAKKNIELIYGGGSIGMMGEIASAVLNNHGKAIGVIPTFILEKEIGHNGLTEQYIVNSMHERKEKLISLSDGYLILPGGVGTMDELFEVLALVHLGIDKKPCGILNINHYYDLIIDFLHKGNSEGFIPQHVLQQILIDDSPQTLLQKMLDYAHA
ncbi:MAG: TIGR00730 family Rossman fold protein [Bacteroidetes bacterium]|nr:TIGR00730 family Rossman fold protein [Bacteroidota bacterium]